MSPRRLPPLLLSLLGCAPAPGADPPLIRDCALQIMHRAAGYPGRVEAVFADGRAFPLTLTDAWRARIELSPGRHLYRLEVDGRPLLDAENPLSLRQGGEDWSSVDVADCSAPALTLEALDHTDRGPAPVLRLRRIDSPLDPASVRATVAGGAVPVTVAGDRVTPDLAGLPPGKHRLVVEARDLAGRPIEPFSAPFWQSAQRFRWQDALIYQVVLDRFAREAPFTPADRLASPGARLGGDLRGLLGVLEGGYFERLGADVLWISALNTNPDGLWPGVEGGPDRYSSYHGYWPVAPREVDPRFGTEADLEALVTAAHARGIRVLMDVVLNHLHAEHPYAAAHPEWLTPPCICGTAACPWSSHIQTCWFTPYLPDLAWDDAEVVETQVDDALWWLERFDLDGLRVDAVPMMPRFVTRHLTQAVHRRLEGLRARHFLLGETFTGPRGYATIRRHLGPPGLDGQFDFPLMWALREAFAWESTPLWALADAWQRSEVAWAGSTAVMGLFVGNHDVTRFLSEAAGQVDAGVWEQAWRAPPGLPEDLRAYARLVLAQAFVLTAPGAPVLYYGDEFGMPGVGDPDNRRPMRFGGERSPAERATAQTIARLGRLRRCLPALRRGPLRVLRAEAERLSYLRDVSDGAPAFVVLTRDPTTSKVSVPVPPGTSLTTHRLVEVLSGREVEVAEGRAVLSVSPRTPAVLIPAGHRCLDAAR